VVIIRRYPNQRIWKYKYQEKTCIVIGANSRIGYAIVVEGLAK